jgi:DNA-binding transcriptional LysR family regulator
VVSPLYDERYVVALPPGHRLASREGLRIEDLDGEPHVDRVACEMRAKVQEAYAARGLELYAAYRTDREDWVQGLVLAGLGFAFVPEHSLLHAEPPRRPLVDPVMERTITLVRSGDRTPTPALQLFWETLLSRTGAPGGLGVSPNLASGSQACPGGPPDVEGGSGAQPGLPGGAPIVDRG